MTNTQTTANSEPSNLRLVASVIDGLKNQTRASLDDRTIQLFSELVREIRRCAKNQDAIA